MTYMINGPAILMALSTIGAGLFHFNKDEPPSMRMSPRWSARAKPSTRAAHDLSSYTKDAQQDFIQSLPGLDHDPGFKQFAGYLTVDEKHGRRIFYWYVESKRNPANDPVVLWTNGGPGCSGLIGFGTEHGPYVISFNGTLSENPFSWNRLANMLYIETPAGVGFSYSDTHSDYKIGDAHVAKDNYEFIRQFLKRFPERQPNRLYISSESYGGEHTRQQKPFSS
jgi:carboxypeptidase C (cathepsin A)